MPEQATIPVTFSWPRNRACWRWHFLGPQLDGANETGKALSNLDLILTFLPTNWLLRNSSWTRLFPGAVQAVQLVFQYRTGVPDTGDEDKLVSSDPSPQKPNDSPVSIPPCPRPTGLCQCSFFPGGQGRRIGPAARQNDQATLNLDFFLSETKKIWRNLLEKIAIYANIIY